MRRVVRYRRPTGLNAGWMPLLPLAAGQVELWILREEDAARASLQQRLHRLLAPDEQQRETQLRLPADRLRFIAGRALLRWALSRYVARAPQDWRFVANTYGRPELAEADGEMLSFNLSHTAGMIVCAVARDVQVGADVEDTLRPIAALTLASRFFTPAETRALQWAPAHQQQTRFYAYWTLKEAIVKAHGFGLALSLQSYEFTLPDHEGVAVGFQVRTAEMSNGATRCWIVKASTSHLAAVAVIGREIDDSRLMLRCCVPLQCDWSVPICPWHMQCDFP